MRLLAILVSSATLSFLCGLPAVHADDFMLVIDRDGISDEVPALLNVTDYFNGEAPFSAVKNDVQRQEESLLLDVGYEHSGHGTRRLMAIADALVPETPPIVSLQGPLSEAEQHVLCAMRKAQIERSEAVTTWLAALLSERLGRPSALIKEALEDAHFCETPPQGESVQTPVMEVHLRRDGVVVSSNLVWNVCVAGGPIGKDLIMRNRDTFEHRRGHVHRRIPYSCRDYHRGDRALWRHPDVPDLEVMLDDRGRLVGGLPWGYIAVRDIVGIAAK